MLAPQVLKDLGHDATVDLVVARHLAHQLDLRQVLAVLGRDRRRGPGSGHRARAVGESLAPFGLDEAVLLHRAGHRLEAEAAGAPGAGPRRAGGGPPEVAPPRARPPPRRGAPSARRARP